MEALSYAVAPLFDSPLIFFVFGGIATGIIGGALPGISASIMLALALPFTYGLNPISAIAFLASIYIGGEYGGSIPAILIRTPASGSNAVTVIDGYAMYQKGKGPEALGISLVAGVIGGMVGLIALIGFAGYLADVALLLTAPAYFSLGVLGMSVISSLSGKQVLKGFIAATLGLMVATIGTDPVSGVARFTFGSPNLLSGIKPVVVMIGVFALSEMISRISRPSWDRADGRIMTKLPSWALLKRLRTSLGIGSAFGLFEGLTPGGGGSIATFMCYNEAKRWSKHPEEFGHGSPEGIAAPEAANNTVATAALIPTLSFGIPGSNSTAVLIGGLLMHGLTPGPMLFLHHPEFVYGLYSSLVIANLAQLPVGLLVLVPCIWLVNRPQPWLISGILALIVSGAYCIQGSTSDLWIVLIAGVAGYVMRKLDVPILPFVLGVVLGYLVESNYRRSLLISNGDHTIFLQDPLSAVFLIIAALIVGLSLTAELRTARRSRG
jgi:putative tricarboxylic transport membrane protein